MDMPVRPNSKGKAKMASEEPPSSSGTARSNREEAPVGDSSESPKILNWKAIIKIMGSSENDVDFGEFLPTFPHYFNNSSLVPHSASILHTFKVLKKALEGTSEPNTNLAGQTWEELAATPQGLRELLNFVTVKSRKLSYHPSSTSLLDALAEGETEDARAKIASDWFRKQYFNMLIDHNHFDMPGEPAPLGRPRRVLRRRRGGSFFGGPMAVGGFGGMCPCGNPGGFGGFDGGFTGMGPCGGLGGLFGEYMPGMY